MVCVLVDQGYVSRTGAEHNAIYVLQELGQQRIAAIAQREADQAASNAARRRFVGANRAEPSVTEDCGPWF